MTITVLAARNELTANAGQTIFNYTFKIFSITDLNVYITPAGQAANDSTDLTTAYTVLGVGDEDGGTITLTVGANLNDLVTIVSNIPSSRTTDYQNNGDFRPDVVNDDFDRVVSLVKKTEDLTNRTLVLPQSQQGPKPLSLPNPESGKVMSWKTDLSGMENKNISELSSGLISSDKITYSFDDLAEAIVSTDASLIFNGSSFRVDDRNAGAGGGAIWNVVSLSSVTVSTGAPTIGNIVASTGFSSGSGALAFSLQLEGTMSAKTIGAKAADNSFDNGPVMILAHELNSNNEVKIAFPKSIFFFATTVPFFRSDTWFGGFASVTKGWGTDGGATQFVWNGAAGGDGMVIAGVTGSKVDPTTTYDIVENLTLENFALYPETDFQINHGIEFDASALTASTGFIRNIQMNSVSVEKCGSHNVVLRGDVFDFKSSYLTSRQSGRACFRTVKSTVNAGLRDEPDQIWLYNPVLFALKQTPTVTVTDAWACDASGTYLYGGNIQGSLGFRVGFGGGCFGTHIEHEEAGPDGSIGLLARGSWMQLFPKWIVGYKTAFQVGESGATNLEGINGTIPLIDCKSIANSTAVLITSGGARNGDLTLGEIKDTTTDILDNRGLAEFLTRFKNKTVLTLRTLTVNSSTPSVIKGTKFRTLNTVATNLTDLLNGQDGEELSIRFEDNNTTIKIVGNPRFDSSAKVDITPVAFAVFRFQRDNAGNRWIVIGE